MTRTAGELEIRKISGRILIVDDEPANVRLLERMLGVAGCTDIHSTMDPRQAQALCKAVKPNAVLLDLNMPFIDGITLLRRLTEDFPSRIEMPILLLTADVSAESKHRALQAGASDFLTKPFDALELVLRLGNHLRSRTMHLELVQSNLLLESRVKERTADLEEAQAEIIDRLAVATESRDDATGGHVERVATMSARIAEELRMAPEQVAILQQAARLHDIGKIAVPDSVLLKEGKLTAEEYETVRRHAVAGGEMLQGSRLTVLVCAEQVARHHHERWDGGGYPDGLRGEEIPLVARIVSVADVFDALTNSRPYKPAWDREMAIQEITRLSGLQFDPTVVKAFVKIMSLEPSTPIPLESRIRRAA